MSTDDVPATLVAGRFRLGDWTVDPALDEIARDGEVVKLEPRKMLLLVTLASRPGDVVTLDELLETVWPNLVVTQSSIYQSVAQLRKTLGDNRATPEYIATVPRKGYRLVAAVGPATVRGALVPQAAAEEPAPIGSDLVPRLDAPPRAPGNPTRRRWLVGSGVAAGALAVGVGAWWWSRSTVPADGVIRIAVLPFADQSEGNIEQAAADGLANDVIHRFERVDRVLVLARNSTFTFRRTTGQQVSLRLLKEQLNADYALLGELVRTSERVRVTARLLTVSSGTLLWSNLFVRPAERLAELPDAIASGALKALGVAESTPPELHPLEAYELYLLGLNALQSQRTMEGLRKARDYFQHAIDTDPGYARAYAGVALTWLSQALYGVGLEFRDVAAHAQPLIDKALAIDPTLLEGLLAQGKLYLFTNWIDAGRARGFLQKAVDLYPGNAEAHFGLGVSYAYDEQPREAMRRYATALELDPLNYLIHSRWGQDATFAGDYETARVRFARAAILMPKQPWRFLGPAQADYARGHLDDAIANYRLQFEQEPRRPDAWGELAWFYLDLGLPAQARQAFDKRAELNGQVATGAIAQIQVALAEGRSADLPGLLTARGLDRPIDGPWEIDRLALHAIAGRPPAILALDALVAAMHADATPWVGSYWIFMGSFAWVDLAMLYDAAGSPPAAKPLLDQAAAMLERLQKRGNAFHTIPYLEARIAALRGQRDLAITRLGAAVDAGWRRTWTLRHDPAFRSLRDDARVQALVSRVEKDMAVQRTHVG